MIHFANADTSKYNAETWVSKEQKTKPFQWMVHILIPLRGPLTPWPFPFQGKHKQSHRYSLHKLRLHDSLAPHTPNLLYQRTTRIERLHVVPAANTLPNDQHIRHRPPSGSSRQRSLEPAAEGMLVEFNDVGSGNDGVFVE